MSNYWTNREDWNEVGRRVDKGDQGVVDLTATVKKENEQILFDGKISILHGELEHEARKKNYF